MRRVLAVVLAGVIFTALVVSASTVAIGFDGSGIQHIALHDDESQEDPDDWIEPMDLEPLDVDDILPGNVIPEEYLTDLTPQVDVPTPDQVGISQVDPDDENRLDPTPAPSVWTGYYPNGTRTEFQQDPDHFEDQILPDSFPTY